MARGQPVVAITSLSVVRPNRAHIRLTARFDPPAPMPLRTPPFARSRSYRSGARSACRRGSGRPTARRARCCPGCWRRASRGGRRTDRRGCCSFPYLLQLFLWIEIRDCHPNGDFRCRHDATVANRSRGLPCRPRFTASPSGDPLPVLGTKIANPKPVRAGGVAGHAPAPPPEIILCDGVHPVSCLVYLPSEGHGLNPPCSDAPCPSVELRGRRP